MFENVYWTLLNQPLNEKIYKRFLNTKPLHRKNKNVFWTRNLNMKKLENVFEPENVKRNFRLRIDSMVVLIQYKRVSACQF